MPTRNLLYASEIAINDKISIKIPTVGDVIDDEDGYYGLISALTAMPVDYMVQLEDWGLDFTSINAYELFLILFEAIRSQDTSLIFGELDLSLFERAVNERNNQIVLLDRHNDIVIDRAIHSQIASALRKIHHLKKNNQKPANDEGKRYMLERARIKYERNKRRKHDSQLESLIIGLVNTEQYKYDYESTLGISIYQFNESVRQVMRKIDYDNRMIGVYAGTVDVSKADPGDLTWIGSNTK